MSQKQMTESTQLQTMLAERSTFQLGSLFVSKAKPNTIPIILSASDEGVARNGGRRGARMAPECLINILKKQALPQNGKDLSLIIHSPTETNSIPAPEQTFAQWQAGQASALEQLLISKPDRLIHLGGGHDCILPLLLAMDRCYQRPLTVINIDAHLDTRTDVLPHSGTPFRQFSQLATRPFELLQIGIHPWANVASNYAPLAQSAGMKIISVSELLALPMPAERLVILSIDADGLDGALMPAVSAVNGDGLNKNDMAKILNWYKQLTNPNKCLGLYEYNPIYDNLSQVGGRYLSSLIYRFIF